MDDRTRLKGRVALVTGASRGIGRAISIALAGAGADVAVNYRERGSEAEATAGEIARFGIRAIAVRADVSSPPDVAAMMTNVVRSLGPIDIVVNNAGIAVARRVDEVTLKNWDETINVNLRSAFLVSSAAIPSMRERRWGRLIFIGSTAANVGGIVGPDYAASKVGLVGLMHFYAAHLAREGITANVIAPALIETEMTASLETSRTVSQPVGRFGTPGEVAEVALMLATNEYVTGQTINVNGGRYFTS
jgi:3-oxoacyl-[acyl-carrier protein] reductase